MAKLLDRMKTAVGLQEENQQPTGFWESLDESTTLSRTQVGGLKYLLYSNNTLLCT